MDRLRPVVLPLGVLVAVSAAGEAARGGQAPVPGALATTVRVVRAGEIARTLRECRGPGAREWAARTVVVDRRAGRRRTLAFRTADARFLASCESIGFRIEGRRWCAPSTGTLYRGRLRDPRLNLCQARGRRPVAFMWVTPRLRARWVAIAGGRRTEVYRVAAGLPVRVSTDRNIRVAGSSATLFVRQYDGRGRLLVRQRIVARVSG